MPYEIEKDKKSLTDLCVICGSDTGIPKKTHMDFRKYCVEGAGQLCEKCGEAINHSRS